MLRKFTGLLKRGSAVVVLASLAAFAGKASALAFVGDYDPVFVTDFSGSWSGQVTIDVPDICIPDVDKVISRTGGADPCSGLRLLSATVDLKKSDGTIVRLEFPNPILTLSRLNDVEFENGLPTGINGFFNTAVITEDFLGVDGVAPTSFKLFFEGFLPVLYYDYTKCIDEDCTPVTGKTPLTGAGAPKWLGPFRVVPEPGSLALLLPALGALGLVRRRRDRAPAAAVA